jgi:hypothetical protein
LSVRELRELLRTGTPAERACVLSNFNAGLDAGTVLGAADREALIGPAAFLVTSMPLPAGALSAALRQAITFNLASDPNRRLAALIAVRRVPERILAGDRGAIFGRAWHLAQQPIDPYSPNPINNAARSAAAALLSVHPDLRTLALRDLQSSLHRRALELVYAAALQQIREPLGECVAAVFDAVGPSTDEAMSFAQDCDRRFAATEAEPPHRGRGARRLRTPLPVATPSRLFLSLTALVGVPTAGAAIATAVGSAWHFPLDFTVGLTTVVTVAGILVAVHVLASELAADRLPGPVARATAISLPQSASYGCVLALAFVVWNPFAYSTVDKNQMVAGIAAALVLSFAATLQRVLARTDPAEAGRIFAAGERARAIFSGRRAGKVYRLVVNARTSASSRLWVRLSTSEPLASRRVTIRAKHEGYLLLRQRSLRRLSGDPSWEHGGRLWIWGTLGALVHPGDGIASIVLPHDHSISGSTRRRCDRLFKQVPQPSAERSGEAIAALIDLVLRLGEGGNEPAAARVARRAVELLDGHRGALEEVRGPVPRDVGAPVGVSRTAALSAVNALARTRHPAAREALTGLIERALPKSERGDAFLLVVLARVGDLLPDSLADAHTLIWHCGCRAVEIDDRLALRLWWDAVRSAMQIAASREQTLTLAGRVIQYAVLVDSPLAVGGWDQLSGMLSAVATGEQRIAIRAGASALLVGSTSFALRIALWLKGHAAWPGWQTYFQRAAVADYETAADQAYGHLLGPNVDSTLQDFVAFGQAVTDHVS